MKHKNHVRKTRRTLKIKSKNILQKEFIVVGTNANGISSKKDSVFQIISQLNPSVLCMQETKVNRKGVLKIQDYEIFENIRSKNNGGSLLTAVHSNLEPVLISENDESEILVIQAKIGNYDCRFINAYGPQEYAKSEEKTSFYSKLDQEVKNAKLFECLICIELDANAKIGYEMIKNDPNKMSANGEYFLEFVKNNNLVIGNVTELCEGTITRSRKTVNGLERSVLDYFVMCQELFLLLKSMKIDEEKRFALTRYSKNNGKTFITKSDHNVLYCKFQQSWNNKIKNVYQERYETFNFNTTGGIEKYKELTSSDTLSKCIKGQDILKESNKWLKEFKNILHRCFKKIRITKPRQKSEVVKLMREKDQLFVLVENLDKCLEMKKSENASHVVDRIILLKKEIEKIDIEISNLISDRNVKKIKEHFHTLSESGGFSVPGVWSLKNKFGFKSLDTPTAKKDKAGNLVTSKPGLLRLYRNTYIDRLAPKEAKPEFLGLQMMKENLFNIRFEVASLSKSDNWSVEELEKVCKSLKNRKARDELGFIYELFKPSHAGKDVYLSLTKMFNSIKEELKIPDYFKKMSITSFYKNKGSRSSLENDRGVFSVVKLRSVLEKLIYKDTQEIIERNLSSSNIGGRKGRNIRDHLFVIYGLINDVISGRADDIDLQFYDIHKCFDEMNYEETHNDLWDVGLDNDKFAIIAKLDEKSEVVVKTPCGTTDKIDIRQSIMQGTVYAPMKCTVQIDTLGRECLANGDGLYEYKKIVKVPALAMIDDVLGVTTCSDESVKLNSIINAKVETKKLRLSSDKCAKLHIGKREKCDHILKAHEVNMQQVSKSKYLGDIINNKGTIDDTIADRKSKSIGIISKITTILDTITFGMYYVDTALILREAMLVNGILTNCEIWYRVTEDHIKILESADITLFRKIFMAHSKTALEIFYLETGKIPLRYIVSKRRLLYLWNILKCNDNELIKKTYNAQKVASTKNDWFKLLESERLKFDIVHSDDVISKMSKYQFKSLVNKKVNSHAFEYLKQKAKSHKKSEKILENLQKSTVLKSQLYLRENMLYKNDCQLLFKLRSRMLDVKNNFSHYYNNDLTCRTCRRPDSIENEQHLLKCENLIGEINSEADVDFEYLFGDFKKQKETLFAYKAVLRKREILLKFAKNHETSPP